MEKHAALVCVSVELLADFLGLPADVRVVGVAQKWDDILAGTFQAVVEHPSLPVWHEAAEPEPLAIEKIKELTQSPLKEVA